MPKTRKDDVSYDKKDLVELERIIDVDEIDALMFLKKSVYTRIRNIQ